MASQSVRGVGLRGPLRCAGAHGRRRPSALCTQKPPPRPLDHRSPKVWGVGGGPGVASKWPVGRGGEASPSEGLYRPGWRVGRRWPVGGGSRWPPLVRCKVQSLALLLVRLRFLRGENFARGNFLKATKSRGSICTLHQSRSRSWAPKAPLSGTPFHPKGSLHTKTHP